VLDVIARGIVWRAMARCKRADAGPGPLALVCSIGVWDLALLGGVAVIVAIVALLSPPNSQVGVRAASHRARRWSLLYNVDPCGC
jgi:hypothetical protein